MQQGQSLYVLQAELIDRKVEVAVNNNLAAVHRAIANLDDKIVNLRQEMHHEFRQVRGEIQEVRGELKGEIQTMRGDIQEMRFDFGSRLGTLEGFMRNKQERQVLVRKHFLDYSFKAGWTIVVALLLSLFSFLGSYLHTLLQ